MKYLLLKFQSAKLFYNSYKTKDYIIDYTLEEQKMKRENSYCFKEPLTKYQISNMLHVLFGERPSATLKNTIIEKNEYLFNKAENSYLNIISAKTYNKNKNEYILIKEKSSLKKMAYNSWSNVQLNWEIIKIYLGNDIFNEFTKKLNIFLGYYYNVKSFNEIKSLILNNLNNDIIINIFEYLKNNERSVLIDILSKEKNDFSLRNNSNRLGITLTNSIDDIVNLSGDILVPINDEDINKLNEFKGTCNILDGGFVYIDKVIDENDIDIEYFNKFIKVCDISVETINYKK